MDSNKKDKPRRRDKGKGKAPPQDLPAARPSKRPQDVPLPASPEASSSKLPQRDDWEYMPIAQNEISRIPPVWSRDGRFYFMAAGGSVQIYSTKRLSTISAHTKPITAMTLHPSNPLHLITSSMDGTIRIWDWVEGRCVKTIKLAGPVLQLVTGRPQRSRIFCTVESVSHKKNSEGKLQHAVYRVQFSGAAERIGKLSAAPTSLVISPSSTYLVALAANKAYAYRLPKSSSAPTKIANVKFVSDQVFTCGAFSPGGAGSNEEWFATGDVKGVIRLWHGLQDAFRQIDAEGAEMDGSKDKRLPTTSLHWHAHAVAALAFTTSGAQLLSVGEESVLVQWHLASGKREYIPRLGGRPIISLGVKPASRGNEEEWWMAFADGSVKRVGGNSGTITQVGQGVKLDPLRPTNTSAPYPLAVSQPAGHLVVPSSHPSTLQFIDPSSSAVIYDLEVAPSNRIVRRDDKEITPVAVEQLAFNRQWMATVEGRQGDEAEGGGDVRTLKIWRYEGAYKLNTQLPRPHGPDPVVSISLGEHLLTCSSTEAKLWSVRQARKSEQGKQSAKRAVDLFWSIRSTFSYRSMTIYASAFSPDGTVAVLVHGPVITLWDVESNVMLRVLDAGRHVDQCAFVGDRYLVAAGQRGLVVWDLLSCEVVWSTTNKVDHLITTPSSSSFATFASQAKQTTISIYRPDSPTPQISTVPLPLYKVVSLGDEYIGVAPSGEIYRFGPDVTATAASTQTITAASQTSASTSIWQEMFGRDAFLDELALAPVPSTTVVLPPTLAKPTDVFDGPSHILPPVSLLFDAFMAQLLKPAVTSEAGAGDSSVSAAHKSDAIVYRQEDEIEASSKTASQVQISTREVTDDGIRELEGYFKKVLSDAPPLAVAADSNPRLANGGTHAPTPLATPQLQKKKASQNGHHAMPATALATPQSEESREKKHSKKRRAPKE